MQVDQIQITFGVWIWIYFSNQLQLTCCNLNIGHISTLPCFVLHIGCALYYFDCVLLPVFRWLHLLGRVDLGDEFNLTSEECYIVIVSKASSPLFDHVYKIPVPSHSRKCMFRMSPWYVLPLVEPIPLHDLSFCHSSKQTTILADLGVVW